MNLEVCGIGHPLGLFFGVFSASSFFLLLFFVKKQCSLFDSSLPATSLAGCGGGGGGLGGRGDPHRELTRRTVYKNHA